MHKKLFIPGPVEVNPEVLEKMATPLIGHRTKDATALQQGISEKMQKVMNIQLISCHILSSSLMSWQT